MPTLPAAGYSTPQAPSVGPAPEAGTPYQSGAAATPDAFGYQVGAGLNRLAAGADEASQHMVNIQNTFNEVAADNATNQTEDKINKVIYGDPDVPGDVGFIGLRGENAMRAYPDVRKQIDQILQQQRGVLQNSAQQLRFDRATRQIRTYMLSQVGRHYDSQFDTFQTQEAKANATLNASRVSSAAAEGDQGAFDTFVSKSISDAQERATRLGLPQSAADAEIAANKQHAVKEWANGLAARGDAIAADAFIDRNKAFAGDQYDNLKREFHAKAKDQQVYNAVFGGPVMPGPAPMVRGGAIEGRIAQEAAAQNVDPTTALATASIESSMGRNLGSRGNIFQLGNPEWAASGGGQKGDPNTDIHNGINFLAKTQTELSGALGRNPQPWEVYLAHQQGVGGAAKLLSNPNAPAGQLVPAQNIRANGGDPNAPASSFAALWRDKFASAASKVAGISSASAAPVDTTLPTAPDAAPVPAAPTSSAPTLAMGDSIAAHLIRKAGAGGQESGKVTVYNPGDTAVSGYNPANVLKIISDTPADKIRGQNVVLSTGTSNDPKNTWQSSIPEQIKTLQAKGAASVTVMGVGTKFADRNSMLAQLAQDNGAKFSGPLQKPAADGIHSADPTAELAAAQQAMSTGGAGPPATPGQSAITASAPPVDPSMRPDSAVPGLQAKLAEIDRRAQAEHWPPDVYRGAYALARERLNAAYTDEQRNLRAMEVANKKTVQDAENDVIADHYSDHPKLSAAQVSVDHRFDSDPQARMRMLALLKPDKSSVDPVVSANTKHDLMKQITDGGVTDRAPVVDAYNAGRLTDSDFNFLNKQVEDVRTPEGLKLSKARDNLISAVKGSITKSNQLLGKIDPSGDLQLGVFINDIERNVEQMRKDGKSVTEIADQLNPKRYLEDPTLLQPYQKTMQQSIQSLKNSVRSAPPPPPPPSAGVGFGTPTTVMKPSPFAAPSPPAAAGQPAPPAAPLITQQRLPGESPADYLKRTGGGKIY